VPLPQHSLSLSIVPNIHHSSFYFINIRLRGEHQNGSAYSFAAAAAVTATTTSSRQFLNHFRLVNLLD